VSVAPGSCLLRYCSEALASPFPFSPSDSEEDPPRASVFPYLSQRRDIERVGRISLLFFSPLLREGAAKP